MARFVRRCVQCGALDMRGSWSSLDDAAKHDVFDQPWTCSSCAWTEFELAETDDEEAPVG